ncbi:MAG: iron ABC transporter permease [Kiritimatiellae bacterium]|nr:iron ABC transporter permease [Kiritimatiellia bacterium]MDD5520465.1 iron ABC transporter permease [Kiritimatiellia bacterium]
MRTRSNNYIMLIIILVFLAVFLVWPMAYVFKRSFIDNKGFTLFYFGSLLSDPLQLEAIRTSLIIALLVTLVSLVIASPIAWIVARRSFPAKALISGLILLPMILPPFVGALGMKMIFARCGALSTLLMNLNLIDHPVDWLGTYPLFGVILLEALHLYPVLYLNLVASFANIDPSLEESAANLGATPWHVFRRIVLPLSMPGIFAGTILVFIWSFTELGTPLVFGLRRVLPVMIYDSVSEVGTNPAGYAQVVLLLLVAAAGFWISKRLTRSGNNISTLGRLSVSREEKKMSPGTILAVYLFIGFVICLSILPHISVLMVASSKRWFLSVLPENFTVEFFRRAVGSEMTQTALFNSLSLSLCASIIDLLAGFTIAWLCVRRRIAGSALLDTLSMLPLAVPGLIIAFGYMGCFSGLFHDHLTFLNPRVNPMVLLAVSYAIRRLPYMVRAAHSGLEQTSTVYEEAAANLGASPFRVVLRVTFPLIAANLLAGGILCFAFSMLEVSDSLILAQSDKFYPITKAIYALMDSLENGVNVASALGAWGMALLAAALLWASCLLGKRLGQMFRIS